MQRILGTDYEGHFYNCLRILCTIENIIFGQAHAESGDMGFYFCYLLRLVVRAGTVRGGANKANCGELECLLDCVTGLLLRHQ